VGAVTVSTRPPNKLLASLRGDAYARIEPKLRPTHLRAQQILYHPNQSITEVYFPESAVICQMTVMENGDTLETATVGLEGASWISASVGAPSMPCETIVVISGDALVLSIGDLEDELKHNGHFRDVLTEYSHALLIHTMRLTGCTGLHSLEQRCARWILTTLDRVQAERFSVTHELLSRLLGSTRPSVSVVLGHFKERGMLDVEHGRVLSIHREQLLTAVCECYQIIKNTYAQVGRPLSDAASN
jgi:CRP-like cAMP-binding protein